MITRRKESDFVDHPGEAEVKHEVRCCVRILAGKGLTIWPCKHPEKSL